MSNLAQLAASRESQSKKFAARMAALAAAVPDAVGTIAKAMFIAGSNAIIVGTPVDTGRLRYGWNPSVGEGDTSVPPKGKEFPAGDEVAGRAASTAQGAPPFPRLVLTNNTEYAAVIELGGFQPPDPGPSSDPRPERLGYILVSGGFSTKAPEGMLLKGVAAIEGKLREFESAARSIFRKDGGAK